MNFDDAIRIHTQWKMKLSNYIAKPDRSLDSPGGERGGEKGRQRAKYESGSGAGFQERVCHGLRGAGQDSDEPEGEKPEVVAPGRSRACKPQRCPRMQAAFLFPAENKSFAIEYNLCRYNPVE